MINIRISAADNVEAIRSKVKAALEPFDPTTRRRLVQDIRVEAVMDDGHEWNCGRSPTQADPLCARCQEEAG